MSQEQPTLTEYEEMQPTFARHRAEIQWILNNITRRNPVAYKHGITIDKIEEIHKNLVKSGRFKKVFATYKNRIRETYYKDHTSGKHIVHGEKHYFSLALHDVGFVDHSRCLSCTEKREEAEP